MHMESSVVYGHAVELYIASVGEPDEVRLEQRLREVIGMLQAAPAESPTAADAFHLSGICWYELPQGGEEEMQRAKDAFIAALGCDPSHQYANLFLGHVLFDTGQYSVLSSANRRRWSDHQGR
jgi:hypothetical protein